MGEQNPYKPYELEERTLNYARGVYTFTAKCSKTTANNEIIKQIICFAGSVGANYIEANESLSKKDFDMRVKICRKETKESRYWLNLIEVNNEK